MQFRRMIVITEYSLKCGNGQIHVGNFSPLIDSIQFVRKQMDE